MRHLTPADFDPYRAEITDCHCSAYCLPIMWTLSNPLWGAESWQHRELCGELLDALKAGKHVQRTFAEYVAHTRRTREDS